MQLLQNQHKINWYSEGCCGDTLPFKTGGTALTRKAFLPQITRISSITTRTLPLSAAGFSCRNSRYCSVLSCDALVTASLYLPSARQLPPAQKVKETTCTVSSLQTSRPDRIMAEAVSVSAERRPSKKHWQCWRVSVRWSIMLCKGRTWCEHNGKQNKEASCVDAFQTHTR